MTNPQDAGPHSREGAPAPGTGSPADEAALPDKPILEWTEEDWARWIAGPPPASPAPPDPSPAAPGTSRPPEEELRSGPEPSPEEEPEIWVELDTTSEMDVWPELDADAHAGGEAAAPAATGEPSARAETDEPEPAEAGPAAGVTDTAPAVALDVVDGTDETLPTTTEERDAWAPEVQAAAPGPTADGRSVAEGDEGDEAAVAKEVDEPGADGGEAEADEPLAVASEAEADEPLAVAGEVEADEPLAVAGEAEADEPLAVAGEVDEPLAVAGEAEADEPLAVASEDVGEPSTVSAEDAVESVAAVDEPLAVAGEDAGEPSTVTAQDAGESVGAVADEAPAGVAAGENEAAEADQPLLPVAAEDAGEDAGEAARVVGPEPAVAPVPPDEEPARPAERVEREREWWEAVPPPLPPPSRPSEVAGRGEAGPGAPAPTRALRELADVPPAGPHPVLPSPPARAAPARGAPGSRARPAPPRAQPVVIERSHRVRSALGLLGVAVLVGTIVAGLITVAIFAISVALRRAVG